MAEAVKVCVLDDYQGVASSCADWASLGDSVDVTFYSDNADDWATEWSAALVERCAPYDVVVTMRERSRIVTTTSYGAQRSTSAADHSVAQSSALSE